MEKEAIENCKRKKDEKWEKWEKKRKIEKEEPESVYVCLMETYSFTGNNQFSTETQLCVNSAYFCHSCFLIG